MICPIVDSIATLRVVVKDYREEKILHFISLILEKSLMCLANPWKKWEILVSSLMSFTMLWFKIQFNDEWFKDINCNIGINGGCLVFNTLLCCWFFTMMKFDSFIFHGTWNKIEKILWLNGNIMLDALIWILKICFSF